MYCDFPFYIVTTKPASAAARVLCDVLGLDIPEESPRLFAGQYPPEQAKSDALRWDWVQSTDSCTVGCSCTNIASVSARHCLVNETYSLCSKKTLTAVSSRTSICVSLEFDEH